MSDKISERLSALSPEQRALFEAQMKSRRESSRPMSNSAAWAANHTGTVSSEDRTGFPKREIKFSFLFFSDDGATESTNKYRLLIKCAEYADQYNFTAVWTPERHFNAFGGLYPNPAVISAALAMVTSRVQLRAGSVVLPLQNPLRVAEEWSVVDNLSGGRIGVAFASGWHADDFVLAPESYSKRRDQMFEGIETVKALWRGEKVRLRNGAGDTVETRVLPRPLQRELPIWITATSTDTFIKAGEIGANVLTGLMEQGIQDSKKRIDAYRLSLERSGYNPESGQVAMMLHTFIGKDLDEVREKVRKPFCHYLGSFLRFTESPESLEALEASTLPGDREALLNYSFDRYFNTSALLGTPETCMTMVDNLRRIGVDEIACLLDFGLDSDTVLDGLDHLRALRDTAVSDRVVVA